MSYTLIHLSPEDPTQVFDAVIKYCYPDQNMAPAQPHAFLHKRLVLLNNEWPCGRVSIYFNPYIENGTWLLGEYACIDHQQAAAHLLEQAETYVHGQGGKKIIGPINGSTWDDYRFNTSGSAGIFFTEKTHNLWYPQQFVQNGFVVNAQYFSSRDDKMLFNHTEVLTLQRKLEQNGIHFREINLHRYEQELKKLHPFVSAAFSTNHLYSPISETEFIQKYLAVKQFIDPKFVMIAENEANETMGLIFCLPDHFNTTAKGLVVKTIARKNIPDLRGLGHVMGQMIYAKAHEFSFSYIIHAFIHTKGTSVAISKNYSGIPIKQYTLYEKEITQ